MKEVIEKPDIELITDNPHKDVLEITITKNKVKFYAGIDNIGACWEMNKKELLNKLGAYLKEKTK